ncbi:MAG TPA: 50S ribosomal protein L20 [Patescibacteria group bacterium]|nr:50S ribosomal protein L20 [Patescibacteria group bacterium]
MPRVKRGVGHTKRRHNLHKLVKGYQGGLRKLVKQAKTASTRAGAYAYADRRKKKRTARQVWSARINAATRANGTTYSRLLGACKKAGVKVDRKILATLSRDYPQVMSELVKLMK